MDATRVGGITMPVDPSNPDTFEDPDMEVEDIHEPLIEQSPETPVVDAVEQRLDVHDEPGLDEPTLPDSLEANPVDAVEQARVVDLDDEDLYR